MVKSFCVNQSFVNDEQTGASIQNGTGRQKGIPKDVDETHHNLPVKKCLLQHFSFLSFSQILLNKNLYPVLQCTILAFRVTSFLNYLIKQIGAEIFPAVVSQGFWIIANSWGEQNWGYPAELRDPTRPILSWLTQSELSCCTVPEITFAC